jgi:tRNA dimethylallyltransferase
MERERLYRRIDERSAAMVQAGLVEEMQDLLDQGYSADLKPLGALGYRHMIQYLQGEWTLEQALRSLQRDTRRYAKRQLTWFRAEPEAQWIPAGNVRSALEMAESFLQKTH